ncbi:hypothetical protein BDR05DRAFT_953072 [Suillus weaverae]|nr:hypothetical protein BDR05DRAFT_953072 [Suillus weaverae]
MSTLQLSKSIQVVETCVEMWELNVSKDSRMPPLAFELVKTSLNPFIARVCTPFALNPSIAAIICTATFVLMVHSGRNKSEGASEKTQYSYNTKLEECLYLGTNKEQNMRLKAEKKAQKAKQAETSSAPAYLQFPMDVDEALIMDTIDMDKETSDMDGHGYDMDKEGWNTADGLSLHFDSKPHYGDTDNQNINSDADHLPNTSSASADPALIASLSNSESPAPAEASEIPASNACNLILKPLYMIFIAVGLLTVKDNTAQILTTAFGHTGLTDMFQIDTIINRSDPDKLQIGVTLGFDG